MVAPTVEEQRRKIAFTDILPADTGTPPPLRAIASAISERSRLGQPRVRKTTQRDRSAGTSASPTQAPCNSSAGGGRTLTQNPIAFHVDVIKSRPVDRTTQNVTCSSHGVKRQPRPTVFFGKTHHLANAGKPTAHLVPDWAAERQRHRSRRRDAVEAVTASSDVLRLCIVSGTHIRTASGNREPAMG